MGQAKQRGTFEERRRQAINRDLIEAERQLQERREREAKEVEARRLQKEKEQQEVEEEINWQIMQPRSQEKNRMRFFDRQKSSSLRNALMIGALMSMAFVSKSDKGKP